MKRLSSTEKNYILHLHRSLKTTNEIAELTGRDYTTIRYFLLFNQRKKFYTPDIIRSAIELKEKYRWNWEEVAKAMDINLQTFYRWKRQYNKEQQTPPQQ